MKRLTRTPDEFECRLADGCLAADWMKSIYGQYPGDVIDHGDSYCDNCPFMKIINRLAEYEDKEEGIDVK